MAKERMNNLLTFKEFDHLQTIKKPNELTEVGGFSVLEKVSPKQAAARKKFLEMIAKKKAKSAKTGCNTCSKDKK